MAGNGTSIPPPKKSKYDIIGSDDLTALRLKIQAAGFSPIPTKGKRSLVPGWQNLHTAAPAAIAAWATRWSDHNGTGLLTRLNPGLDIDILDHEAAAACELLVRDLYGDKLTFLVRVGQAPKRLILFRTKTPFGKITALLVSPDGSEQKIELLCDGQMFVALGLHQDTGRPYMWYGGTPGEVSVDQLIEIDEAEAKKLVAALVEMLVRDHGYRVKSQSSVKRGEKNAFERVGLDDTDEAKARFMLDVIPNDDLHYDEWTRVGMALWSELPTAEDLFHEWSKKSKKYEAAVTRSKWRGFASSPPTQLTVGTLYFLADEADPEWRMRWAKKVSSDRREEQKKRNVVIGDDAYVPDGPVVLTVQEMVERLVHVGSTGCVVDRMTGMVRKKDAAVEQYAASVHKKTACLKLWIKSPLRVGVDALVWVPGAPTFCEVPEGMGGHRTGINTWRGLPELVAPTDWRQRARPFFDHIEYLVPVPEERTRFLQWLGHIPQAPGVLPHTAWLFIAETQGIGRNLLASILVRVLRGHVAAGMSVEELIDDKFNGRLSQKLLCIIDEIHEGVAGAARYQREKKLRAAITQETRLINPKYGVQTIEKNCLRHMAFSNFNDAIPFDMTDRRWEVVRNPTEPRNEDYYTMLYGLMDDRDFIASVRQGLQVLSLAGFSPGARARMNETKVEVIEEMKPPVQRAVDDFKEAWPRQLALVKDIEDSLDLGDKEISDVYLAHAIKRAGMVVTRRIWTVPSRGQGQVQGRVRHRVVIVRPGEWTKEAIAIAEVETLFKEVGRHLDGTRIVGLGGGV